MSIEFTVTCDHEILEKYYALRERCYRQELGLAGFDGAEDEMDRYGQILVAIADGEVLAGARISQHISLPSQIDSLELNRETCCMWERLAIDSAVRTVQFFCTFGAQIAEVSREAGYRHAMVLSSMCNARFYRRCLTSQGVDFEIHRHVPHCATGSFAGLEHYLSVAYLDAGQRLKMAV